MSTTKNKVQLIGNLGRDPEVKDLNNGQRMVRMSLATTDRYKAADGQWKEDTQWHTVVAWGKQAEQISSQLRKGTGLLVEGRLVHRRYEKGGEPRYATEVVLSGYQVLAERASVA